MHLLSFTCGLACHVGRDLLSFSKVLIVDGGPENTIYYLLVLRLRNLDDIIEYEIVVLRERIVIIGVSVRLGGTLGIGSILELSFLLGSCVVTQTGCRNLWSIL